MYLPLAPIRPPAVDVTKSLVDLVPPHHVDVPPQQRPEGMPPHQHYRRGEMLAVVEPSAYGGDVGDEGREANKRILVADAAERKGGEGRGFSPLRIMPSEWNCNARTPHRQLFSKLQQHVAVAGFRIAAAVAVPTIFGLDKQSPLESFRSQRDGRERRMMPGDNNDDDDAAAGESGGRQSVLLDLRFGPWLAVAFVML